MNTGTDSVVFLFCFGSGLKKSFDPVMPKGPFWKQKWVSATVKATKINVIHYTNKNPILYNTKIKLREKVTH